MSRLMAGGAAVASRDPAIASSQNTLSASVTTTSGVAYVSFVEDAAIPEPTSSLVWASLAALGSLLHR